MPRFQRIVQHPAARKSAGARAAARALEDLRPVDLKDAWRFAEAEAGTALRTWLCSGPQERRDAYTAYVAALDREQAAAGLLAARLEIVPGERD